MPRQNRRARAANRINQVQSKLESENSREHVGTFLEKYFLCEVAVKEMIVGYKDATGDHVAYKDVKMHLQVIRAAIRYYGLQLPDATIARLFASSRTNGSRTAKSLRNSLVHGMAKQTISDINAQYTQLITDMQELIDAVLS